MKKFLSVPLLLCAAMILSISCQKEVSLENEDEPLAVDSTLLLKLEMVDSSAAAPQHKSTYSIGYDSQKRMSYNKYYFYWGNIIDSTYRANLSYQGNDTLPSTLLQVDLLSAPVPDTIYQMHYYTYDAQKRISKDSVFVIRTSQPTRRDTSYVVEDYTYSAGGFSIAYKEFSYSSGNTNTRQMTYNQQKDARGNIISEYTEDAGFKYERVLTYDNNPNPLYKTYLPHYPSVELVYTTPYYLANINPQPNNLVSSTLNVRDLATNTIVDTWSVLVNYVYKDNGYPLRARQSSTPAQFTDGLTFNYFYRN